ncbi:MAG: MiaB/RimO family radical SAM methylthiotransferase, partial [Candidatus Margulisiibacteriota bacterium]
CQMNVADSSKLAEVLEEYGYQRGESEETADILLINTCVVRQGAEDRAAWYVMSSKGLKEKHPGVMIGLCGCIVNEPGRDIKKDFPHIDFFIPPHSPNKLKEFLSSLSHFPPSPLIRGKGTGDRGGVVGEGRHEDVTYITVMTGCNNYCSYCVVPYVRGPEVSRPMAEVLAEIEQVMNGGAKNIILLGQNVNAYQYGLANLLENIAFATKRRGSESLRVGFLTSHPKDMSDEIIESAARFPFIAREFIMPLQSGDDAILEKMRRGYTLDYFRGRVNKLRELMPDVRLVSDLIVGFPGETDAQFEATLRAVEEFRFSAVNMFAYSPRPETDAAKFPGQLSEEVRQKRLKRLITLVRSTVKPRQSLVN